MLNDDKTIADRAQHGEDGDTSLRLQAEVSKPIVNLMNVPSIEVNMSSIATSPQTARNRLLNARTRRDKIQTRNSPAWKPSCQSPLIDGNSVALETPMYMC